MRLTSFKFENRKPKISCSMFFVFDAVMVDNCGSINSEDESQQRETHALRDLFRTSSDSESSDVDDQPGLDDNNVIIVNQALCPQESFYPKRVNTTSEIDDSIRSESSTTVVRTVKHIQLEFCTVGGSIEHRLWPAADYLVSYILRQQHHSEFCNESNRFRSKLNGKNSAFYSDIVRDVQTLLQRFVSLSSTETVNPVVTGDVKRLKVLELGAGVGYTSLELAHHLLTEGILSTDNIQFLLTDLYSAIPLLKRNVDRNFGARTNSPIQVQKLEWGNMDDIQNAINWCNSRSVDDTDTPLLILGSDCVYWESLYGILEVTIATLLKQAVPHSICLLANARRWKRDTHFFQNVLGQSTATSKGQLRCICLHEHVTRSIGRRNDNDTEVLNEQEQRQVMRIYAVQWVSR